jgi:hypothetical protein
LKSEPRLGLVQSGPRKSNPPLSFKHLATVLISVFTLCYGPGLLFRGPFCISQSQEFDFYRGHGEDLKNVLSHTNTYMFADVVQEAEMLGLWNAHWPN